MFVKRAEFAMKLIEDVDPDLNDLLDQKDIDNYCDGVFVFSRLQAEVILRIPLDEAKGTVLEFPIATPGTVVRSDRTDLDQVFEVEKNLLEHILVHIGVWVSDPRPIQAQKMTDANNPFDHNPLAAIDNEWDVLSDELVGAQ